MSEYQIPEDLKPCPFCGSKVRWASTEGGDDSWEIQCSKEDCCLVLFAGATAKETAAAWNTRADEIARLEALEEAIEWLEYSTPEESLAAQTQRQFVDKVRAALQQATGKESYKC